MKLAYFSPMPPARTGIATYSRQLLRALAPRCEVTVFTPTPDAEPVDGVRLVRFSGEPRRLHEVERHDQTLFHIGNNPWYHLEIANALSCFPGPACLHDVVLYFLAAGAGRGGLLKELMLVHGHGAHAELRAIEAACPDGDLLRYPTPSRHPCLHGVLRHARQVIVHNHAAARKVAQWGYGAPTAVIPILHYADAHPPLAPEQAAAVRRELGYDEGDFVIGAFGFIGPTKRIDQVLRALAVLRRQPLARRPRLLVVGEGDALAPLIDDLDLGDCVRMTGFVGDEAFRRFLCAVDVLANLRYPSHGESSASLVQAMSYARVCLVTDDGSFAEMPEGSVVKVPHDESEVDVLVRELRRLAEDPAAAAQIGAAARDHAWAHHAPDAVATRLLAILSRQDAAEGAADAGRAFDPAGYLRARVDGIAAVTGA